jgi:hypothetical protein
MRKTAPVTGDLCSPGLEEGWDCGGQFCDGESGAEEMVYEDNNERVLRRVLSGHYKLGAVSST